MSSLYACLLGFMMDLVFGDPNWKIHPIRLIGHLISASEKFFRKIFPKNDKGEAIAGFCMALFVALTCLIIPYVLIYFVRSYSAIGAFFLESVLCFFALSTKSLKKESVKIYKLIKDKNIDQARQALSMIVGRDTENLNQKEIIKATVETVAENTTDGVVAPLLFMLIGGAPFAYFYKAVNTMDSMIGYKNEKYLHFGKFAAKLDDQLNYIPAKLGSWVMIFSAMLLRKFDGGNAKKIYLRDRFKHASPNSAHAEAAFAGALRIQLAGDAYYFGEKHKKEYIGDSLEKIVPDKILAANQLLYATAGFTLIGFAALKFLYFSFFL